jgi:hypothetical protein
MSRSKFFLVVAGSFLGTSFLLSAQGAPIFADEWDYFDSSYYSGSSGSLDYFAPPQTYVDQDPFNIFSPVYNYPYIPASNAETDTYQLFGTVPLWGADYQNAYYSGSSDSYQDVTTYSQPDTMIPQEDCTQNNVFQRILSWRSPCQSAAYVPVADEGDGPDIPWGVNPRSRAQTEHEGNDPEQSPSLLPLSLPPGWGANTPGAGSASYTNPERSVGSYSTGNQFMGDARFQWNLLNQANSGEATDLGLYSGRSAIGTGPQLVNTSASDIPERTIKSAVLGYVNEAKNFVFGGSAGPINITGVGRNRIEFGAGNTNVLLKLIPGGAYVQGVWQFK